MLEAIRKYSSSFVIKALFTLLILSFLTWGVGDFVSGRVGAKVVAEVGDVGISPAQFSREYMREVNRLERVFGTKLEPEQARALGLPEATVGRLINETLYDLGAQSLGVTASDAAVLSAIHNDRTFQDQTGQFSRDQFQQVLMANGYSEQGYIALLRGDLMRNQLASSVQAGVEPPKLLVDSIYRHRAEKRVAQSVFVADSAMSGIPEPTAEQLAAFHADHAELFTAPEYRQLTYVDFRAKDLEDEVAVSDEEISDLYAQRQAEFDRPEMRHLRQIVVPDEAKAEEVHRMLEEGRDFVTVAKDVAGLDEETVDIGEVSRSMLLDELAEVAFSLPAKSISEPVQSPLGWHVLQVVSVSPAHRGTLEEARDALTAEIKREKAVDALFDLANTLEDTLGGGATLEEAASRLNLRLRKVEAVDATGRDPKGNEVDALPGGSRFLEVAFETPENEDSLVTEAGSDGYFAVHVNKVTPSALRPLDEVRTQVVDAWKAAQREIKAKETAEAVAGRLKGGEDIAKIAGELGVEVRSTEPFTRQPSGADSPLPRAVVAELFKVQVGDTAVGRGDDGYVVARLQEVQPANPATDPEGVAAVERSLTSALRNDIQSQYTATLHDDFSVTVNRQVLEEAL